MTREEAKSCKCTIEMLQRLAYNIHGVMDVIDADNCKKIIKVLEQEPCETQMINKSNFSQEQYKADLQSAYDCGKASVKPCEDAISRQSAIFLASDLRQDLPDDERISDMVMAHNEGILEYQTQLSLLPPVIPQPKTEHCKNCKWWKDSDGVYRRGIGEESQCPINRKEVYEGNGYCYMFKPPERSDNR